MRLIIERYLIREIALTFLGVTLLLLLMFFSSTFIRLLSEALEGDYPVGILFSLFALKAVGKIVFILPFAFFIAVLLAFGRLYKDNEVVVLFACGAGPGRLFSSVAKLALLVALVVGCLTLYFAPWAAEQGSRLLDVAGARQEIEGIVPGRFNNLGFGEPTIYAEAYDAKSKRLSGLFVLGSHLGMDGKRGEEYLLSAKSAYERIDPQSGARYLVLENGVRYEGVLGQLDYRVIRFAEHGIHIRTRPVVASERPRSAVSTLQLWNSDDRADVAELHWRIAMPISTLLLALLAVPLSKSSPRQGRYAGLFLGILTFLVYKNLLTFGQSALSKGSVPPVLGMWWVHALLLMMLGLLLWRQQRVRRPRSRAKERHT